MFFGSVYAQNRFRQHKNKGFYDGFWTYAKFFVPYVKKREEFWALRRDFSVYVRNKDYVNKRIAIFSFLLFRLGITDAKICICPNNLRIWYYTSTSCVLSRWSYSLLITFPFYNSGLDTSIILRKGDCVISICCTTHSRCFIVSHVSIFRVPKNGDMRNKKPPAMRVVQ